MDVLFLDANVLFSAAWLPDAGLLRLWELDDVEFVTSGYAAEEARRNLDGSERLQRLEELLDAVRVVPEATDRQLPRDVELPPKDRPILQAAIAAGATHLLTGDVSDFGELLGCSAAGVRIERPGAYLGGR